MPAVKVTVLKGGNRNNLTVSPVSDARIEYLQEDGIQGARVITSAPPANTYFDYNNGVSPYSIPYWVLEKPEDIFNQASDLNI